MRPVMNIHDLYPNRRQLVAWMKAGVIVDVESDGEIIARIEPAAELLERERKRLERTTKTRRG